MLSIRRLVNLLKKIAQLAPRMDAQSLVNTFQVCSDRRGTNVQRVGNLAILFVHGETRDLLLGRTQGTPSFFFDPPVALFRIRDRNRRRV